LITALNFSCLMKITYYFRHPSPVFHSIEEQFFTMQEKLPGSATFQNVFAKYPSKGLFKRIFITISSAFSQSGVNHITGDIHFVAAFLKKERTVLTIHDIGSVLKSGGVKQKILKFFWFTLPAKRVRFITVISEFTKQQLLETIKINPGKVFVIPDCVSPEIQYDIKEFNEEFPTILQVGTKDNKNLPNLISAVADIKCKLDIIGKLTNKQEKLLNEKNITYTNSYNLEYSEIIQKYKNADIVNFVSDYEGFGVPILEAQATGRVVITSNISPMKEVAGKNSVLISPNNSTELNLKIKQIISDANYRINAIEAGTLNVKKYSAKAVAQMYFDIYKKITE